MYFITWQIKIASGIFFFINKKKGLPQWLAILDDLPFILAVHYVTALNL